MTRLGCIGLAAAIAISAHAKVVTKVVEYKHGDVVLEGMLAWDDATKEKRPGVLVVHEWWGCNEYAKGRAKQLAEMGYVAFALDMYGKGRVTADKDQAGKWSAEVRKDAKLWRERAMAGLNVLAKDEHVDPKRIAAIGYCFGGSTCLQLAYGGADLAGVVSFHGSLMPPGAADTSIKARILICHGDADPMVPPEQVAACEEGLKKAGAMYKIERYPNAVHSFTNPNAGKAGIDGVAYDEAADKKSWQDMKAFFDQVFRPA